MTILTRALCRTKTRYIKVQVRSPTLFALTVPPAESTARVAGRRVGVADVEILTEQVTQLRQLDYRYGSGRLREQVVSLLHHEAN
jgi:hypothetical protein